MAETHRMSNPRKILIKDLNVCLTCTLCGGYFIDATTIVDCSHTFCRACIVRHFESSHMCPSCGTLVHKSKPLSKIRSDNTLQSLVYKLVPSLYTKELQRRSDFYHSTGIRPNSACSDDSVLGDTLPDSEEWVRANIGDPNLFYSPDDTISLSVEYYTQEIINAEIKPELQSTNNSETKNSNEKNENGGDDSVSVKIDDKSLKIESIDSNSTVTANDSNIHNDLVPKRYLQCPAAVRMFHLQKFLRMKFALSNEHRVDIIYAGEVLPSYLSLMDVAYTFKWKRESPMRFFYLIYVPTLRPVAVQEIPVAIVAEPQPPIPPLKIEITNNKVENKVIQSVETKISKKNKEIKIKELVKTGVIDIKKEDNNNVKIVPKSKPDKSEKSDKFSYSETKVNNQKTVKFVDDYAINNKKSENETENCVYDYSEPDKDEIKAFAEKRDREWALQKYSEMHVSKKRKKNKHSKNEMHKKHKLHAEITSNEVLSNTDDSLKLKVKLSVPNGHGHHGHSHGHGHKHKHRNSGSNSTKTAVVELVKTPELTPKERLLQMRQVRHKHVSPTQTVDEKAKPSPESSLKIMITSEKVPETPEPTPPPENTKPEIKTTDILTTGKTLRSDYAYKTSLSKELCNKLVRVSLEKVSDKIANRKSSNNKVVIEPVKKTNTKDENKNLDGKTEIIPIETKVKTPVESNASAPNKLIGNNKIVDTLLNKLSSVKSNNDAKSINDKTNSLVDTKSELKADADKSEIKPTDAKTSVNKTDEHKMVKAPLTKSIAKIESKPTNVEEPKVSENKLNNQFKQSQNTIVPKNITVSKVETGTKRKLETAETTPERRPSLEITVINLISRSPPTSAVQTTAAQSKPVSSSPTTKTTTSVSPEGPPAKKIRPPPLTIPLEMIQKMNNINKANIQKQAEKCDIFGALDLSAKPNTSKMEPRTNDFRSSSASPKPQMHALIRSKTPVKTLQEMKNEHAKALEKLQLHERRLNTTNLQMLSESAAQRQQMILKTSPISSVPNLIKNIPIVRTPNPGQKAPDYLQKIPNFQARTPNLIPKNPLSITKNLPFQSKSPNFTSKNLQRLPKLNEINKGQFSRINAGQNIRSPRPSGQNQTVRNIPNPSLLVRQQNQNRINSINNSSVSNHDSTTELTKPEGSETEKRPDGKPPGPPPLKPIESFKK